METRIGETGETPAELVWELARNAPWGLLLSRDKRIVWHNRRMAELLGAAAVEQLRKAEPPWLGLLLEASIEQVEIPAPESESAILRRLAARRFGEFDAHYFEDGDERQRLLAENARLRAKVRALEVKDAETGLLNRNAVLRALENQISLSRRYGNPLSAIRLSLIPPSDADDPHPTLQAAAQECNAFLRWTDRIGRVEKTAFLLVLPETPLDKAKLLAAELTGKRFARLCLGAGWKIETSIADWRRGDDARKLLQRLRSSP